MELYSAAGIPPIPKPFPSLTQSPNLQPRFDIPSRGSLSVIFFCLHLQKLESALGIGNKLVCNIAGIKNDILLCSYVLNQLDFLVFLHSCIKSITILNNTKACVTGATSFCCLFPLLYSLLWSLSVVGIFQDYVA